MFKSFSMDLAGRKLTVEVGRVAAQANGAAFMHLRTRSLPAVSLTVPCAPCFQRITATT